MLFLAVLSGFAFTLMTLALVLMQIADAYEDKPKKMKATMYQGDF
jgi:hypothetical protein